MTWVQRLLDLIAVTKNYYTSATTYVNVANFIMLAASFKLLYGIDVSVYLLVPLAFTSLVLLGYLDYRFILGRQVAHANQINDLKHQLDRIEQRLTK